MVFHGPGERMVIPSRFSFCMDAVGAVGSTGWLHGRNRGNCWVEPVRIGSDRRGAFAGPGPAARQRSDLRGGAGQGAPIRFSVGRWRGFFRMWFRGRERRELERRGELEQPSPMVCLFVFIVGNARKKPVHWNPTSRNGHSIRTNKFSESKLLVSRRGDDFPTG